MSTLALRPRTASELVDATFQLTRAHYVPLLVLSTIMTAPTLVVSVLAAQAIRGMSTVGVGGAIGASVDLRSRLMTFGALFLASLWYFVIDGAMVWYAAQVYLGHDAEPGAALRRAFARTGRLIASNVVRLLFVGLGMLIPIVGITLATASLAGTAQRSPGTAVLIGIGMLAALAFMFAWLLFVFARYIVAAPVLMLEDRGPVAALIRSSQLMIGARRKTAMMLVLAFVVYIALALLASAPFGLVKATTMSQLVRSVVQILLYPLFACLVTLIYYDRRVRKEALDIELLTGSLGSQPGADAA